eukprot:TRINITY_DN13608_c0_g1_i1.p1 TRINITY_DN13608_c0_g1~~TRINITY_DN13608_c0_g1_i1.p1  ORF type:complete len:833 (+),score=226.41 TRINITY_DN13608_c0_g1_i1:59-2557(+)
MSSHDDSMDRASDDGRAGRRRLDDTSSLGGRRSPASTRSASRVGRWAPPGSVSRYRSRSNASARSDRSDRYSDHTYEDRRETREDLDKLSRNMNETRGLLASLAALQRGPDETADSVSRSLNYGIRSPAESRGGRGEGESVSKGTEGADTIPWLRGEVKRLQREQRSSDDNLRRARRELRERERDLQHSQSELAELSQVVAQHDAGFEELRAELAEREDVITELRCHLSAAPAAPAGDAAARRREGAELLRRVNGLMASVDRLAFAARQLRNDTEDAPDYDASRPLSPRVLDAPGGAHIAEALKGEALRIEEALCYITIRAEEETTMAQLRDEMQERDEEVERLRRRNESLLHDVESLERRAVDGDDAAGEVGRLRDALESSERSLQAMEADLRAAQDREAAALGAVDDERMRSEETERRLEDSSKEERSRLLATERRCERLGAAASGALRLRTEAGTMSRVFLAFALAMGRDPEGASARADSGLRLQLERTRRELHDARTAREEALTHREQELRAAYDMIRDHENEASRHDQELAEMRLERDELAELRLERDELAAQLQEGAAGGAAAAEVADLRQQVDRLQKSNAQLRARCSKVSTLERLVAELGTADGDVDDADAADAPDLDDGGVRSPVTPRETVPQPCRSPVPENPEARRSRYPYLGLDLGVLRDEEGATQGIGLRVVECRGPAATAGLYHGDVITYVKDRDITDLEEFRAALLDHPPTDPVYVRLVRDGILYDVDIIPTASERRPGDGARYTNRVVLRQGVRGAGSQNQPHPHRQHGSPPQRATPRRAGRETAVHTALSRNPMPGVGARVSAPPRSVTALRRGYGR